MTNVALELDHLESCGRHYIFMWFRSVWRSLRLYLREQFCTERQTSIFARAAGKETLSWSCIIGSQWGHLGLGFYVFPRAHSLEEMDRSTRTHGLHTCDENRPELSNDMQSAVEEQDNTLATMELLNSEASC